MQRRWTEEEHAVVVELIGQEFRARDIGAKLGRSKNAVIGFCNRNGLKLSLNSFRPRPVTTEVAEQKQAVVRVRIQQDYRPKRVPRVVRVIPMSPARTDHVEVDCCRWPLERDGEGEWLLCAAPVKKPDDPYCVTHALEAFKPSKPLNIRSLSAIR